MKIIKSNETESALKAGMGIAATKQLQQIGLEQKHVLVPDGCSIESLDAEMYRPARKKGHEDFVTVQSFCWYVNNHKIVGETIIKGNKNHGQGGEVTACFNHHGVEPGWRDFTATLNLKHSSAWSAWKNGAERIFTQADFAEFLEDHRTDLKVGNFKNVDGEEVKNPSYLELSKMILDLQVNKKETVSSKINPTNGDIVVEFKSEEHGERSTVIPSRLYIAVPIYENGDLFQVCLRTRYSTAGGKVTFSYLIDQKDRITQKAFELVCERIEKGQPQDADHDGFEGTGMKVLI